MKKLFILIAAIALVTVGGCKKSYEYMEPKIMEVSAWSNGTWVAINASVNYLGEKYMFVDVGKQPDLSDAHRYEMQQSGDYEFTVSISDLDFGSKYYYRVEAGNTNFSMVSEVKHFKLTEAVLLYGDDRYDDCWGLKNGGNDEWAVMFPTWMLSAYEGASIVRVKANIRKEGNCTLRIYEGGMYSPTTMVKSKDFVVSSIGWNEIVINPLSLNTEKNLWVSMSMSYEAGEYPKGSSVGTNNPNARWQRVNGGSWRDVYYSNDNRDLTWLINVYISTEVKGDKGVEIKLPQMINDNIQGEEMECLLVSCSD